MSSNSRAVRTNGEILSSATEALAHTLQHFVESSSQSTMKLQSEAKQFESKELEMLASHSGRIEQQLRRVQETTKSIQTHGGNEAEALKAVQTALKETHDTLRTASGAWEQSLNKSCSQAFNDIQSASTTAFTETEKAMKLMASLMENALREALQFLESERQNVLKAQTLANDAANTEIKRLRHQNETLSRMLASEQVKADKAKEQLIQQVSGLLGAFANERDKALRDVVGAVQGKNTKAEEEMTAFTSKYGEITNSANAESTAMTVALDRRSGDAKRTRDGALKVSI